MIDFTVDGNRIRQVVKQVSKREITTAEGETFLALFRDELFLGLSNALRNVIVKHFGEADRNGAE